MADNSDVPQIFDEDLRAKRLARARMRFNPAAPPFLLERCLEDITERLTDINRQFNRGVCIGPLDITPRLAGLLPPEKMPLELSYVSTIEALEDNGPKPDLIISLLDMQSQNDVPGQTARMARALRPDGILLMAVIGGESLREFRHALYAADEALLGGLTARISPMMTHHDASQLLARAGLNLPVIDVDRFSVNYSRLENLLNDIRDIGESNQLCARRNVPLTRPYLAALKALLFSQKDTGETFTVSFEILWLTGWSPHESQQKPLKPGSAKMRLADALGTTEQKL